MAELQSLSDIQLEMDDFNEAEKASVNAPANVAASNRSIRRRQQQTRTNMEIKENMQRKFINCHYQKKNQKSPCQVPKRKSPLKFGKKRQINEKRMAKPKIRSDTQSEMDDSNEAASNRSTNSCQPRVKRIGEIKTNMLRNRLGQKNTQKSPCKVLMKKPPLKFGTRVQKKKPAEISRKLLTSVISSSSATSKKIASLKTLTFVPLHERAAITTKNLCDLVYEQTKVIFAFQQRRSFSQMEFTHARRMQHSPVKALIKHNPHHDEDGEFVLKKFIQSSDTMLSDKQSSYDLDKMYSSDTLYHALREKDSRIYGMRIYASIMLNAWRKRRDEVKRLIDEINDLKRSSVKTKNQLHVFSTLFRVEQKRGDELNAQLKRSLEDINMTKNSCEGLTTSLISVKADKALLEQQLHIKEQEYDDLNTIYTQTKNDLFNAMTQQKELQTNLLAEQRKVQQVENQKNDLINEIFELNSEFSEKEKNLLDVIKLQDEELESLKKALQDSEKKAKIFKESREVLIKNHLVTEEKLHKEIERLRGEMHDLQTRLDLTLKDKMKDYLKKSLNYQQTIFQIVHCFIYCLLPSTPPPQMYPISVNFCLKKALSVIKR